MKETIIMIKNWPIFVQMGPKIEQSLTSSMINKLNKLMTFTTDLI